MCGLLHGGQLRIWSQDEEGKIRGHNARIAEGGQEPESKRPELGRNWNLPLLHASH